MPNGPMPNVMAALPNIGGALCSTPQSLADAHYHGVVQLYSPGGAYVHPIYRKTNMVAMAKSLQLQGIDNICILLADHLTPPP